VVPYTPIPVSPGLSTPPITPGEEDQREDPESPQYLEDMIEYEREHENDDILLNMVVDFVPGAMEKFIEFYPEHRAHEFVYIEYHKTKHHELKHRVPLFRDAFNKDWDERSVGYIHRPGSLSSDDLKAMSPIARATAYALYFFERRITKGQDPLIQRQRVDGLISALPVDDAMYARLWSRYNFVTIRRLSYRGLNVRRNLAKLFRGEPTTKTKFVDGLRDLRFDEPGMESYTRGKFNFNAIMQEVYANKGSGIGFFFEDDIATMKGGGSPYTIAFLATITMAIALAGSL
jgi:hypothetical protein